MAIYVFNTTTGELASYCPDDTDPVADADTLAANGLTAVSGLSPLDRTHAWDAASRSVVVVTAPVEPRPIGTAQWIMRFTPAEFQAVMASQIPAIQQFIYALNHTTEINLADPLTQQGVQALVAAGVLTQDRYAQVMA